MAHFITWLDVEREMKKNFKFKKDFHHIKSIYCYSSGMEIEFISDKNLAIEELNKIFGDSLIKNNDEYSLQLDIGEIDYRIEFIKSSNDTLAPANNVIYPLWREHVYIESDINSLPNEWTDGPKFCAFHSFKGGVGRTTSLMTYASAALNDQSIKKILLIDGDLEAPGLTLWLSTDNIGKVTYTNFLESVQFAEGKYSEVIEFYTKELKKNSINIDGSSKEIFILPSAISLKNIMDMPVTPDQISRNIDNPYILSDLLHDLGKKLEVELILIDLRAGLSELSSPLIFDPRIEHFFVTTIANQSILGIGEILKQIQSSNIKKDDPYRRLDKPTVILSMLTKMLRDTEGYTKSIQIINESYPALATNDVLSQSVEILEFDFDENLMSLSNIKEALSSLKKSSIYQNASNWAQDIKHRDEQPSNIAANQPTAELTNLYSTCEKFQFAENTSDDSMLVIDPIRNLAKNYSESLPNIVSIGAKGAGKTFTFLQVSRSKNWNNFLLKVNRKNKKTIDSYIFPWLSSTNLNEKTQEEVNEQRNYCLSVVNAKHPKTPTHNNTQINMALQSNDTNWDVFWQNLLVSEILGENHSLKDLNEHLIKLDKSIIILIDGVEDVIFSPDKDNNHNAAIRSILNLPNALSELQNRKIGLICFIRADYVQSAIKQNINQYISKYQQFRLEWTPESFLRLACWICAKANVINVYESDAESGSLTFLLNNLERLWGKKLGRDNSKEASSARWVFAALCDLNGRLQARDLVRFLKFSADKMLKTSGTVTRIDSWPDRLLAPEAVRRALDSCSEEKVNEAEKEIKPLQQWIQILKSVSQDLKRVPFNPLDVGLDLPLLTSLKELGVIYEDTDQSSDERYYLPEIYRSGLLFSSSVGGRPRVQALLKRNLGGIPF